MLSSRWLSLRPKRDERGCNPFIAILHNLLRLDEGATAKLLLSSCPCFTEPLCKRGQLKTFRSQVCRKRHTNIPMINIWKTRADNKHLIWIEKNKNGLKIGLKWAKNARESRKRITKCGHAAFLGKWNRILSKFSHKIWEKNLDRVALCLFLHCDQSIPFIVVVVWMTHWLVFGRGICRSLCINPIPVLLWFVEIFARKRKQQILYVLWRENDSRKTKIARSVNKASLFQLFFLESLYCRLLWHIRVS